jgi:hypothetical protein
VVVVVEEEEELLELASLSLLLSCLFFAGRQLLLV